MNKKQFIQQFRDIYYHTKRDKHDTPFEQFSDALMNDVIGKSNGGWDETIALEQMGFIEYLFNYQPETVRLAQQVKSDDVEYELINFLNARGYEYEHIPESKNKTPDGIISKL